MAEKLTDEEKKNLELWDYARTPPKEMLKEVDLHGGFTAIDPYWRIQQATKRWGPFGDRWGVAEERFELLVTGLLSYSATLYYPAGDDNQQATVLLHSGIETHSRKAGHPDADCFKKVATDALTKGLSKLGFAADIFMGKFEDEKYVDEQRQVKQEKQKWEATTEHEKVHKAMQAIVLASNGKFQTIYAQATLGLEGCENYKVTLIHKKDLPEVMGRLRVIAEDRDLNLAALMREE